MGLSAPKNRSRISNDPQNTTWANNTDRFGHKMLEKHGWSAGDTLGAKGASHSQHYTVASNSHIRVSLKDDTLGLGAKRGSERAENFGLAGLESILGRLNGREADVKKEEERRAEVERRGWVAEKYGFMNFVSGGFLVGDKIEKKKPEVQAEADKDLLAADEGKPKRKRSRGEDDEDSDATEEAPGDGLPALKRKKKSVNLREVAAAEDETKAERRARRDAKKANKSSSASTDSPTAGSEGALSDKAKRKADKSARKQEKRLKKALKKAAKKAAKSKSAKESAGDSSTSEDEDTDTPTTATPSVPATGTSTPVAYSFGAGGRHAVRARYIRQKKMASMDPQAMREIFMVKTPV